MARLAAAKAGARVDVAVEGTREGRGRGGRARWGRVSERALKRPGRSWGAEGQRLAKVRVVDQRVDGVDCVVREGCWAAVGELGDLLLDVALEMSEKRDAVGGAIRDRQGEEHAGAHLDDGPSLRRRVVEVRLAQTSEVVCGPKLLGTHWADQHVGSDEMGSVRGAEIGLSGVGKESVDRRVEACRVRRRMFIEER